MPIYHEEVILFQLTLSEYNDLQWIKPGKEFVLADEMYDVHSIQKEGGIQKVFVVKDTQETHIRKNLFKQTQTKVAVVSIGLYFEKLIPFLIAIPIFHFNRLQLKN
jgi:hypothetical protein